MPSSEAAFTAPVRYDSFRSEQEEAEPIVFIEYEKTRHGWLPCSVLTTYSGYDFDWCHNRGILCYHESSGGLNDSVELGEFVEPKGIVAKIWYDRERLKLLFKGKEVDQAKARELGYQLLRSPLLRKDGSNPFDWGIAQDSPTEYCLQCCDRYPSESTCHHIHYQDGVGFSLGCGAQDLDFEETRRSLYLLLRMLPLKHVRELSAWFAGPDDFWTQSIDSMLGGNFTLYFRGPRRSLSLYCEPFGAERNYEERYWPGIAWLMSLDESTKEARALTAGWIWQWLRERDQCGLRDDVLVIDNLSAEAMAEWLALDPLDPTQLHDRFIDVSTRGKIRSVHDKRFREAPKLTREVYLWPKSRKPSQAELILSVAEVTQVAKDRWRIHPGAVISRNGIHISEMDDYRLT